jgi:hypothetical protein
MPDARNAPSQAEFGCAQRTGKERPMQSVGKLALLVALVGSPAWGQDIQPTTWWGKRSGQPVCPPPCPAEPAAPGAPGQPPVAQTPSEQALSEAFAQAGEGGTPPAASYMPAFFGDLIGYSATRVVRNVHGNTSLVRVPIAARAGMKITDNESPRPTNRIFYTYNFYADVNMAANPAFAGLGLSRHMVGFEKTFLGGDASFGIRMPFVSLSGNQGLETSAVGDMSVILKYAVINDRQTGDVLSGGLMVTVPTGDGIVVDLPNANGVIDGTVQEHFHSTVLQPYVGAILFMTDRLYLQGFSAIAVPTDSRDVTILWNDLALGYWAYRNQTDRFVQAIVPTFEVHVNTPLNHRGAQSVPIGFSDEVNLTGGCYFILPRATLGGAVGFPIVGPRPYSVEAIGSFTFRF